MFLITIAYQKARSAKQPDKPGRVLFRISRRGEDGRENIMRTVSSDIRGERDTVVETNRAEIVRYIRIIYAAIEKRTKREEAFTVDNIVEDFRLALKGDVAMKSVLARADESFPLRADLVSVGNEFKRDFKFVYPESQTSSDNLMEYISLLSHEAKIEGKQSKVRSYNSTRSSLSKFLEDRDISLISIDRSFVAKYSVWLKENGVADSTQSFYLRTLRSILNRAKDEGLTEGGDDLFTGLNTRVIFTKPVENRDILSLDTLNRISTVKLQDNPEAETVRDMFMFGFYCRGMELADVLNLTKANIQGDMLIYNRRSIGHPRIVSLDKPAKEIINKYRRWGGSHLFPMKDTYKGHKQYSITDRVRRHVKEIGSAVGFPELTFCMNISAWKRLMSQLSVSEMLLKSV